MTTEDTIDLHLRGKRALVTGSSSGIGRAIAEGLAEEGASVAINGRNPATLGPAAAEIAAATGSTVVPIAADVSRTEEVARLVKRGCTGAGRARHPRQQRPGADLRCLSRSR